MVEMKNSVLRKLDSSGFSLLELLIAVSILAIGLLAVAGLQVTAIKGNSHGNTISQATALAEDQIETIRNTDYSAISFTPNPFVEANLDGTIYTRETFVETDTPSPDLKLVTVTVSWSANSGTRRVALQTIVADGD